MVDRSTLTGPPVPVRLVQYFISPDTKSSPSTPPPSPSTTLELHIVLFPAASFPLAKQFWQHTGLGISSRLAERCLSMIPDEPQSTSPIAIRMPSKPSNRHYARSPSTSSPAPFHASSSNPSQSHGDAENLDATYLEERYGRNMPVESAASAKRAMRRRIAGVLVRDSPSDWADVGKQDIELGPSTRGVKEVTEDDVFLYPTGMTAIWSAHQLALDIRPPGKSVCFGYVISRVFRLRWF